jgi:hypothetical protein
MTDEMIRLLSEAIERRGRRPAHEQFEEMIRRGAIDREGNVILRRPEAPGFVPAPRTEPVVEDQPSRNEERSG